MGQQYRAALDCRFPLLGQKSTKKNPNNNHPAEEDAWGQSGASRGSLKCPHCALLLFWCWESEDSHREEEEQSKNKEEEEESQR